MLHFRGFSTLKIAFTSTGFETNYVRELQGTVASTTLYCLLVPVGPLERIACGGAGN